MWSWPDFWKMLLQLVILVIVGGSVCFGLTILGCLLLGVI